MRSPALRCLCAALVLSLVTPAATNGQSLEQVLNDLFIFGGGDDPLFLIGSAGVAATEVHGDHFIPAESQANGSLLGFFNNSIAANVGSFPLSSTVASQTFQFVGGVPTPTSNSFGPIFAERAQTVGRGHLNAGVNYSRLRFAEIRGVDLDDVQLRFVHENVDFPGCDGIFGVDCSLWGNPQFENDVIDMVLDMDIQADVFAFFVTYGLTDWLDLSVAVPVVDLQVAGTSTATISVATGDEANHFFSGTQENPGLSATTSSRGQASGIGDIAARLKARVTRAENWDLGVLAEVRAPTGREEDFLGTGEVNAKGLMILSGILGDFSPHINAGYEFRGSDLDQDEVELIAGFDHRLADWVTLAVDVLSAFTVGDQNLAFPEPVILETPFAREVRLTNIPDTRDDIIDGSLGFKFRVQSGLIIVTNVLVPLNDGGLRSSPIPTLGLEYTL